MKITFLGTGSAGTFKNWQTNIIIEKNYKKFLLDAGGDVRHSLYDMGIKYKDLDAIYISHLHGDHANGIEDISFGTYFDPSCKDKKIQLFGNGDLLRKGWDNCWKAGLESVQGAVLTLDSFFDISMIRPNGSFVWENIEFSIVQSVHVMNGFALMPSYGIMTVDRDTNKTVYFTTDTQFCPSAILDFYQQADIIIQDCETVPYKSGVHANYQDLVTLPESIKTKMILVHYNDNVLDSTYTEEFGVRYYKVSQQWVDRVKMNGFSGMPNRMSSIVIE